MYGSVCAYPWPQRSSPHPPYLPNKSNVLTPFHTGFETCFFFQQQVLGSKTHLKSRFFGAILKKGRDVIIRGLLYRSMPALSALALASVALEA